MSDRYCKIFRLFKSQKLKNANVSDQILKQWVGWTLHNSQKTFFGPKIDKDRRKDLFTPFLGGNPMYLMYTSINICWQYVKNGIFYGRHRQIVFLWAPILPLSNNRKSSIFELLIHTLYFFRKLLAVGDSFPHNNRILHCSHDFLLYSRLRSGC